MYILQLDLVLRELLADKWREDLSHKKSYAQRKIVFNYVALIQDVRSGYFIHPGAQDNHGNICVELMGQVWNLKLMMEMLYLVGAPKEQIDLNSWESNWQTHQNVIVYNKTV